MILGKKNSYEFEEICYEKEKCSGCHIAYGMSSFERMFNECLKSKDFGKSYLGMKSLLVQCTYYFREIVTI